MLFLGLPSLSFLTCKLGFWDHRHFKPLSCYQVPGFYSNRLRKDKLGSCGVRRGPPHCRSQYDSRRDSLALGRKVAAAVCSGGMDPNAMSWDLRSGARQPGSLLAEPSPLEQGGTLKEGGWGGKKPFLCHTPVCREKTSGSMCVYRKRRGGLWISCFEGCRKEEMWTRHQ